jgi:hypothetical protein
MLQTSKLLRRKEASKHLKEKWGVDRAPSTLAKLAVIGGGPPFQRLGRIPLYATDDLDEWVASKLSGPMPSTSDTASPKDKIAPQSLGEECRGPDNETLSEAGA